MSEIRFCRAFDLNLRFSCLIEAVITLSHHVIQIAIYILQELIIINSSDFSKSNLKFPLNLILSALQYVSVLFVWPIKIVKEGHRKHQQIKLKPTQEEGIGQSESVGMD